MLKYGLQRRTCAESGVGNALGVKGESVLTGVVDIPDAIPIDYMHQVLLG